LDLRKREREREEITAKCRTLYSEERHSLCSLPYIIRMIKLRTNAYKILVGKRVRKKLLVRPKRRWKDNIETILKDTVCVCVCVCVCVDCARLVQV